MLKWCCYWSGMSIQYVHIEKRAWAVAYIHTLCRLDSHSARASFERARDLLTCTLIHSHWRTRTLIHSHSWALTHTHIHAHSLTLPSTLAHTHRNRESYFWLYWTSIGESGLIHQSKSAKVLALMETFIYSLLNASPATLARSIHFHSLSLFDHSSPCMCFCVN